MLARFDRLVELLTWLTHIDFASLPWELKLTLALSASLVFTLVMAVAAVARSAAIAAATEIGKEVAQEVRRVVRALSKRFIDLRRHELRSSTRQRQTRRSPDNEPKLPL
jgi:hypothetical protein